MRIDGKPSRGQRIAADSLDSLAGTITLLQGEADLELSFPTEADVPLFLPRSVTGVVESQIRSTSQVGLYHTLREFTGTPVGISDLIAHLTQLRRSELIRLIANMTATVSQDRGMTLAYQLAMAPHVLPGDIWAQVSGKIPRSNNHPGRLFHRRQLWFLLQMAIMVCSEDCPSLEPMEMQRRAGFVALMASDVLAQVENAHMPDAAETPEFDQWAATILLPLIDKRPGNEIICRAICFWIDMQCDPVVQRKMQQINLTMTLDEAFARKHAIGLREFIIILTTAYNVYNMGAMLDPPEIPLLEPAVMSGMPYPQESAARAILLAGSSPDDLVPRLMGPRQSWATDFSPLCGKPLLEILPGKYACADAAIFTLFFMDGIYDLLEEAISKDKFRDLFGTMFERYIDRLFEDFLYSGTTLVRQFAASPKYVGENKQAADGIALLPEMTLLMEYKGGMLTKRQKYGTNIEELITGLNSLLARFGHGKKGVGQLVDNIERLLRGDKIHTCGTQIQIPSDSKIIPTLVVYDDNLGLHAIRNHLDGMLRHTIRERGIAEGRVGPLVVLTTRDIESLQEFSTVRDVTTILVDYLAHLARVPGDMAGSFHGFLYREYANVLPTSSFVQRRVGAFLGELLKTMEALCETE